MHFLYLSIGNLLHNCVILDQNLRGKDKFLSVRSLHGKMGTQKNKDSIFTTVGTCANLCFSFNKLLLLLIMTILLYHPCHCSLGSIKNISIASGKVL